MTLGVTRIVDDLRVRRIKTTAPRKTRAVLMHSAAAHSPMSVPPATTGRALQFIGPGLEEMAQQASLVQQVGRFLGVRLTREAARRTGRERRPGKHSDNRRLRRRTQQPSEGAGCAQAATPGSRRRQRRQELWISGRFCRILRQRETESHGDRAYLTGGGNYFDLKPILCGRSTSAWSDK
jgi:hypothetical protein